MMLFAVEFGPVSWKARRRPQFKQNIWMYLFSSCATDLTLEWNKCDKSMWLSIQIWLFFHLPELDCSAVLQATPRGLLPPSSAELPRRSAVSSPPVYQTGTAPGPSAGCVLPLQGRKGADKSHEYSLSFVNNIFHHPWLLTTITII